MFFVTILQKAQSVYSDSEYIKWSGFKDWKKVI